MPVLVAIEPDALFTLTSKRHEKNRFRRTYLIILFMQQLNLVNEVQARILFYEFEHMFLGFVITKDEMCIKHLAFEHE